MMSSRSNAVFEGTAAWLRGQWSNPSDIFSVLLIIGGDIIQVAIAQVCAGPIPYLTPVSFSFGWVNYAVSALRAAIGDGRLMPKPDFDCLVINALSGYARTNSSWVLARLLRDFDHWKSEDCEAKTRDKLAELRNRYERELIKALQEKQGRASMKQDESAVNRLKDLSRSVRIALRVSVWRCKSALGRGSGDFIYWVGILVTAVQLGIAIIPWAIHDEWYTFFITVAGTGLAMACGSLPQWQDEKFGTRKLSYPKGIFLTQGNGATDVIFILAGEGDIDLEALAAPQRQLHIPRTTRVLTFALAILWIVFLITNAGWQQHTWFLLCVGMIGMVHNVGVAGMKRKPKAWGINFMYKETVVESKVMEALAVLEERYPRAGLSLLTEYFPGKLFPREQRLWDYAARRYNAWRISGHTWDENVTFMDWKMPPLRRPPDRSDDDDIPDSGRYLPPHQRDHCNIAEHDIGEEIQARNGDAIIQINNLFRDPQKFEKNISSV